MRKCQLLFFQICLLTTIVSCTSPAKEKNHQKKVDSSVVKMNTAEILPEISDAPAPFNIDTLFELKAFKRAQRSSHSSVLRGLPLLFQHDNNGFYIFFYFMKQRQLQRGATKLFSTEEFHLITAVKNPLNTADSYLEVEETLVQLQSTINDPLLGSLDLVNQDTAALQRDFGKPTYRFNGYHIYGNDRHILVVNHEKGTVKRFKYLYLQDSLMSLLDQNKPEVEVYLTNFEAPK